MQAPKPVEDRSLKILLQTLQAQYTWLDGVVVSVDEWAAEKLKDWAPGIPDLIPLDPLLVDRNLRRASTIVDKVFIRRNDIHALSTQAISRALEFQRYLDSKAYDRELSQLSTTTAQAESLESGNRKANDSFKNESDTTPWVEGFANQALGSADAALITKENEARRAELLRLKADVADKFEQDLELFHKQANSPLNFSERISKLCDLYLDDLKDAYLYTMAVSTGMQLRGFDMSATTEPDLRVTDLVWQLAARIKNCGKQLEIESGLRVEVSRVFSISTGTLKHAQDGEFPQLDTFLDAVFKTLPNDALDPQEKLNLRLNQQDEFPMLFDLREDQFSGLTRLRLKSVGLQLGITFGLQGLSDEDGVKQSKGLSQVSPVRMDCKLFPPRIEGDYYSERKPILLPDVGPSSEGSQVLGESGENVDSFGVIGEWQVQLGWDGKVGRGTVLRLGNGTVVPANFGRGPRPVGAYPGKLEAGPFFLKTVLLHVRVSGLPS